MRASVALSRRRRGVDAARDACRQASAQLGGEVHGAMAWVTSAHARGLERLCAALVDELGTEQVAGCVTSGVTVGDREVCDAPAVAVMVFTAADGERHPEARLIKFSRRASRDARRLIDGTTSGDLVVAMAAADGFRADPFLARLNQSRAGLVVGGGVSNPDGEDRVFVGREVRQEAIAAMVLPGSSPQVGVAQSCAAVSPVHQVTRGSGHGVLELDGQGALGHLFAATQHLSTADREHGGMMVGLMGRRSVATAREFMVRPVVGVDPMMGTVDMGTPLRDGERIVFLRRGPEVARAQLNAMLIELNQRLRARRPAFAVWTSCCARDAEFYGMEDHDPSIIGGYLSDVPVAGFATSFELGPVGERTGLHLFSGVLAAAG